VVVVAGGAATLIAGIRSWRAVGGIWWPWLAALIDRTGHRRWPPGMRRSRSCLATPSPASALTPGCRPRRSVVIRRVWPAVATVVPNYGRVAGPRQRSLSFRSRL